MGSWIFAKPQKSQQWSCSFKVWNYLKLIIFHKKLQLLWDSWKYLKFVSVKFLGTNWRLRIEASIFFLECQFSGIYRTKITWGQLSAVRDSDLEALVTKKNNNSNSWFGNLTGSILPNCYGKYGLINSLMRDSLFGLLSLWNTSVTGGLQACKKSADKVKQRIKTIPFGFDKMLGRFFRCQCRS